MHCNVCSKHTRPQGFNKEARNRTHGTLLLHRIDESQQDFLPLCLNGKLSASKIVCSGDTNKLSLLSRNLPQSQNGWQSSFQAWIMMMWWFCQIGFIWPHFHGKLVLAAQHYKLSKRAIFTKDSNPCLDHSSKCCCSKLGQIPHQNHASSVVAHFDYFQYWTHKSSKPCHCQYFNDTCERMWVCDLSSQTCKTLIRNKA